MRLRHLVTASAATLLAVAAGTLGGSGTAGAVAPPDNVRLSNDLGGGYVANYALIHPESGYTDATIAECSRSHGRQNEPSAAIDPRNTDVIVGSSNDYCGVYNDGEDANGAPIATGPIWLGYYRSENGGSSFQSSLVPGYPGDTSPYAARAHIRTASAGDPVWAWDTAGRVFGGAEASDDPAGTSKTFGDVWVATYENPGGTGGDTSQDGKEFVRSTVVARGVSAPFLLGKFNDKTAIEVDRTGQCGSKADGGYVYFAWSRFTGNGGANIYLSRSTDHGATWSTPQLLTTKSNHVQVPEITVTGNGHVYVTWVATIGNKKAETDAVQYARSTDCGRTFSPERNVVTFEGYAHQDSTPSGGSARDCGDGPDACQSGYTFFRADTTPRAATDQNDTGSENVYIVYDGAYGPDVPTGTTYGMVAPGVGSLSAVYYTVLNGATGTNTAPVVVGRPAGATDKGHQLFPDIAVDGGAAHVIWWDSRNDPSCADATTCAAQPIGNRSNGTVVQDSLQTFGTSFATSAGPSGSGTVVSDVAYNPNFEQYDGRQVPFAGDYLWIDSVQGRTFGVWSDWRNTVLGTDARESTGPGSEPAEGADVLQCRTSLPDGSISGDTCPRAGGLDSDIYGALMP